MARRGLSSKNNFVAVTGNSWPRGGRDNLGKEVGFSMIFFFSKSFDLKMQSRQFHMEIQPHAARHVCYYHREKVLGENYVFFGHFLVDGDFSGSGLSDFGLAGLGPARDHLIALIIEGLPIFSALACQGAENGLDKVFVI